MNSSSAITIYNIPKTAVDCFTYRNKIGLDVAIEALKDVILNKGSSLRVLVDTNVILSAILYPEGVAAAAFAEIVENHDLFLSDYTISELHEVFEREFRGKIAALDIH